MKLSTKLSLSSVIFKKSLYPLLPKILKLVQVKKIKKGDYLIKEGEICNCFYFVEKGVLRNFEEHNNKEITLWFFTEGEFVTSLYSLYNEVPSLQYIEALEDCEIYKIPKEVYIEITKLSNDVALYVLDELMNQYSNYLLKTRKLRFMSAEEKFEQLTQQNPDIFNRITQKHLASYLGIDHTYLSKIISKYA